MATTCTSSGGKKPPFLSGAAMLSPATMASAAASTCSAMTRLPRVFLVIRSACTTWMPAPVSVPSARAKRATPTFLTAGPITGSLSFQASVARAPASVRAQRRKKNTAAATPRMAATPAGVRTPSLTVMRIRVGSGSSSKGVFTVSMIRGRMKTTITAIETPPRPSTSSGYIAAERSFSRTSRSRSAKSAREAVTSSSSPAASPASTMLTCIGEKAFGPASAMAAESEEPSLTFTASPSTSSLSAAESACSATASSAGSRLSPACRATATCRSIAAFCRPPTRWPNSERPGVAGVPASAAAPSVTSTAACPEAASRSTTARREAAVSVPETVAPAASRAV